MPKDHLVTGVWRYVFLGASLGGGMIAIDEISHGRTYTGLLFVIAMAACLATLTVEISEKPNA